MSSRSNAVVRVHHRWPGENRFHCQGKLVSGPDRFYFVIACICITVPNVVFIGGVLWSFAIEVPYGWLITPFDLFMAITVLTSFFLTAFMDPGIVPRQPPPPVGDDLFRTNRPPPFRDIIVNGVQLQQKYCDTCNLYRTPRTVHCGICNNCVDRFDHHCPWVGNCIGRRNYRWFLVFIYSVLVHSSFVLAICITEFVQRCNRLAQADRGTAFVEALKNPVSLILALYCLVIIGLVGTLGCFHCKLVSQNATTNEHIKKLFTKANPYDRGCINNWCFMCCPPYYPKYVAWHKAADEVKNIMLNPADNV